jgi:hypothetical protein
MKPVSKTARCCGEFAAAAVLAALAVSTAHAAGCAFEPQGEGRVAAVIDARSFRLEDGREVRLHGIEPVATEKPDRTSALSAIISGRDVTLQGEDDTPDRYGRQPAFVYVAGSGDSVQAQLLALGEALVSGTVTDKDCASILDAAEAAGRQAGRPNGEPGPIRRP